MNEVLRVNSRYLPENIGTGIVHIGLGAFHRAHQAVYLERWLNRLDDSDWGICAANIRSNRALVDSLKAQKYCYHVAEFKDSERVTLREVNAIRETLFSGEDKRSLIDKLVASITRIVTLTVTEKAYYIVPAEQRLNLDDPAILHDIEYPHSPKTVPGILLEALRLRREQGVAPFTVLCCDNMPENGSRTKLAVTELASYQSEDLADWIRSEVAFPNSMVDRIVPAMTDETRESLERDIGIDDPAAIVCEAFSQWVIEDNFPLGRPNWETVGVQMVADVRPFETMKLRMLNGSHSLLAYVGLLGGWQTVAEAIADPDMTMLIRRYMHEEAAPTLTMPSGVVLATYGDELITRFTNDSLQHQLIQIAMDGSQKLPQRWLQGAEAALAEGRSIPVTALGVAAWMHYVSGLGLNGTAHRVDDPLATSFSQIYAQHLEAEARVEALLSMNEIFPASLARLPRFRQLVLDAYLALARDGAASCMRNLVMS
ncbi:mannitol dehydrogenase family protein [Halomonas sp. EGI 63088]|uniref:Mannitol dehydrogenase family protein n=1 Tax=Halomonas flagellata TaxID=2920385 RepID=A0ABS9S040_9GAMM|nr:mannitol dehydrogenase family protein [Halomonas flagellata]MCH4565479.1 mannitol dehydrogenase family protein [Halomonas flagellata]